jgi:ATP-binding cassette subfamily B protein
VKAFLFVRLLVAKFPGLLAINTGLLLAAGVIDTLTVLSIAPVVDFLVSADPDAMSGLTRRLVAAMGALGIPASLTSLLMLFVGANFLRSGVMILAQRYVQKTKYAVLHDLSFRTFDDLLHARWYFFTQARQGAMQSTFLREIGNVADAFAAMGQILSNTLQAMLYLIVPLSVSWQVTLLSIGTAVVFAVPFSLIGRWSTRLGRTTAETATDLSVAIQETLASIRIIIGFGAQESGIARYREAVNAHVAAALKSQTLVFGLPIFYYPFGMLVLAVALWGASWWNIPLSNTAVLLYALVKIVPAISGVVGHKNLLDNFYPSYEQVLALGQQARAMRQPSGGQAFAGLRRGLAVEHVSFSYPDGPLILSDIDVRIPKGQTVAFVGESGAGKSTLIDLIMRFHDPVDGRILVDGVPLTELDVQSYRARVGFVPQDSVLFNTSVRENLRWSRPGATDDEIRAACHDAHAAEFIDRLPNGYATIIGDRGVRLSGGQIQRLALARAILRRPEILILDEATSSLDTHSERLIQQALDRIRKDTTLVVVAHRLSTIASADHIYVLSHGRVVEHGSYAELIARRGAFARMAQLQLLESDQEPRVQAPLA